MSDLAARIYTFMAFVSCHGDCRRMRHQSARRPRRQRRGYLLIVVLLTLLIVSLILAQFWESISLQRAQASSARRQLQASWLVDAGIERGIARYRQSADYQGESWSISSSELGLQPPMDGDGMVTIRVLRSEADASQIAVQATAEYPVGRVRKSTMQRQIVFATSTTES